MSWALLIDAADSVALSLLYLVDGRCLLRKQNVLARFDRGAISDLRLVFYLVRKIRAQGRLIAWLEILSLAWRLVDVIADPALLVT